MTIDTLEYVKRLEAAGVDRRQAEAHAQAIRDTLAPQLATKVDLDAAVARLEVKIEASRSHFEMMLWKHTTWLIVTLIGTQMPLAGVLLRFLR